MVKDKVKSAITSDYNYIPVQFAKRSVASTPIINTSFTKYHWVYAFQRILVVPIAKTGLLISYNIPP